MIENFDLIKSVITNALINSIDLLDSSFDSSNLNFKDLAIELAVLLEREENQNNNIQIILEITKEIKVISLIAGNLQLSFTLFKILIDTINSEIFVDSLNTTLIDLISYLSNECKQNKSLVNKLNFVDYNNYSFFESLSNINLHNLFLDSNYSDINALLVSDFSWFCVLFSKKIEVLIDTRIDNVGATQDGKNYTKSKRAKLGEFIDEIQNHEGNRPNRNRDYQEVIEYIYDIRDFTCHFDALGTDFYQKANRQYWLVDLKLENYPSVLTQDNIRNSFRRFLPDFERIKSFVPIKVTDPSRNYCYVTIESLDIKWIAKYSNINELVRNIIDHIYNEKDIFFGQEFEISTDFKVSDDLAYFRESPQRFYPSTRELKSKLINKIERANRLTDFFNNGDYSKVSQSFQWVLEKTEFLYNQINSQ